MVKVTRQNQVARQSQVVQLLILKASKPQVQRKNAVLMGKKTKGHKRHIVTDTMGNLLAVVVHAANIHDTKAGIIVAKPAHECYHSIRKFYTDAGYRGTFVQKV